eukprot:gene18666-22332_t
MIDYSAGSLYVLEAQEMLKGSDPRPSEINRLLDLAQTKLQAALCSMPFSPKISMRLAHTYLLKASFTTSHSDALMLLQTAIPLVCGSDTISNAHQAVIHIHIYVLKYLSSDHNRATYIKAACDYLNKALNGASVSDASVVQDLLVSSLLTSRSTRTITNPALEYRRNIEMFCLEDIYRLIPPESKAALFIQSLFSNVRHIHLLGDGKHTQSSDKAKYKSLIPFVLSASQLESLDFRKIHLDPTTDFTANNSIITSLNYMYHCTDNIDTKIVESLMTRLPQLLALKLSLLHRSDQQLPENLFTSTAITSLHITHINFTKDMVSAISSISSLTSLALIESISTPSDTTPPDTTINRSINKLLLKIDNLRQLSLQLANLNDSAFNNTKFTQLDTLSLTECSNTLNINRLLGKTQQTLTSLDLSNSNFDPAVIDLSNTLVNRLVQLKIPQNNNGLNLSHIPLYANILGSISSQIRVLHCPAHIVYKDVDIEGEGCSFSTLWDVIHHLPLLEDLGLPKGLSLCELMNNYEARDGQQPLFGSVKRLVLPSVRLAPASLKRLVGYFPQLTSLSFTGSIVFDSYPTYDLYAMLLPTFAHLTKLELFFDTRIKMAWWEDYVNQILSQCVSLQQLGYNSPSKWVYLKHPLDSSFYLYNKKKKNTSRAYNHTFLKIKSLVPHLPTII